MQLKNLTIAAKDEIFDEVFKQSADTIEFKNEKDKDHYVDIDDQLCHALDEVGPRLFGEDFAEENLYVSYSWWPNHTRHLEASIDGFTQEYYDEILKLLTQPQWSKWRVQVVVSGSLDDGKTMIGSIVIWKDFILIDRALYGVLTWRKLNFHYNDEPKWLEDVPA